MNLSDLNPEQLAALNATAAEQNAAGGVTTALQLLTENGTRFVAERVEHYYQQAVARLASLMRPLSYEQRLALIAQLEGMAP